MMLRGFATATALLVAAAPAFADTLDGRIVSLDVTLRQLTLESGETFNLLDSVAADQLMVDQVVHIVSADGTIDAVSVAILEQAPLPTVSDPSDISTSTSTPSDDATATGTDVTTDDSSVPSADSSSSSSDNTDPSSTATDQNASDPDTQTDATSSEDNPSTVDDDTTTVTDGSGVDYNSSAPQ